MRSLWVAIDSRCDGTRVLATAGPKETVLKARLSATAQDPVALPRLLEALALWQGMPVRAVVVAGGTEPAGSSVTRLKLDFEADFAGPLFTLELVAARKRRHRDLLRDMGSFRDLRQLVMFEVAR